MYYLAVHDEVADAASEVFVLKLRVDVWDVLIHATKLEHMAHVQVPKTHTYYIHTSTPGNLNIQALLYVYAMSIVFYTSLKFCFHLCLYIYFTFDIFAVISKGEFKLK